LATLVQAIKKSRPILNLQIEQFGIHCKQEIEMK